MVKIIDKNKSRIRRHKRVRSKITGTAECPRLNVFRSSQHIYAQVIDDVNGRYTLQLLLPPRRASRASAAMLRLLRRSAR